MSAKPIQDNLRTVRIEDDNGDLRPLLDVAGEKFADLIKGVTNHNKAGTLTLKISVKPSTAGALAVKTEVAAKVPRGIPPESLLWPTPDGNLQDSDPKQGKLELRGVDTARPELRQAQPWPGPRC